MFRFLLMCFKNDFDSEQPFRDFPVPYDDVINSGVIKHYILFFTLHRKVLVRCSLSFFNQLSTAWL